MTGGGRAAGTPGGPATTAVQAETAGAGSGAAPTSTSVSEPRVPPGGTFVYRVRFPDAGIYWYHPHVREDVQQELGLYGNMLVRSPRADYLSPVHREEVLMLDDLLVGDDGLVPLGKDAATHALMGRFGNVLLINAADGKLLKEFVPVPLASGQSSVVSGQ